MATSTMQTTSYQFDRYVERSKELRQQGLTRDQAIVRAHEILEEE